MVDLPEREGTNICGLFGYITKEDANLTPEQLTDRNNIVKGLAIAMQNRGVHSTGIAGIKDEEYGSFKQAVSADKFVESKEFKKIIDRNYNIIIGHTRYATIGEVTNDNAHPFQFGNIIGCHNGHVTNHEEINKDLKVDSEAIFYLLDKHKNNYKKAFKKLTGEFAIIWFDTGKSNTLYIALDGNPLTIVLIPELKTYFFASEFYAIQAIIGSHFSLSKKSFWTPKAAYAYEINTSFNIKKKQVEFKKYEVVYPGAYAGNYNYSDYDWGRDYNDDGKVKNLIGNKADFNYKKTHGVENPFKKDNAIISSGNWQKVMDLTMEDMKKIKIQVEGEGCGFCNIPIYTVKAFFWHDKEKITMCTECVDKLQVEMDMLTRIDEGEYLDIEEELLEVERDNPPVSFAD